MSNVGGGIGPGTVAIGAFQPGLDIDLQKLLGWQGSHFHTHALVTHGPFFSQTYLGNILAVSNLEAGEVARLYSLWYEQSAFGRSRPCRPGGASVRPVAALQGVVLAPLRFGPGDHVVRPRLVRCGEKGQAIDFKSDGAFWSHTIEGCWWREGEGVTIAHPCLKHGVPPGAPIPALADASYTCRVKAGKVLRASEWIRAGEYRPVP